jgi:hypothetical protein
VAEERIAHPNLSRHRATDGLGRTASHPGRANYQLRRLGGPHRPADRDARVGLTNGITAHDSLPSSNYILKGNRLINTTRRKLLRFLRRPGLHAVAHEHDLSGALQKLYCTKPRVAGRRYGDLDAAMVRDAAWGGVSTQAVR